MGKRKRPRQALKDGGEKHKNRETKINGRYPNKKWMPREKDKRYGCEARTLRRLKKKTGILKKRWQKNISESQGRKKLEKKRRKCNDCDKDKKVIRSKEKRTTGPAGNVPSKSTSHVIRNITGKSQDDVIENGKMWDL